MIELIAVLVILDKLLQFPCRNIIDIQDTLRDKAAYGAMAESRAG